MLQICTLSMFCSLSGAAAEEDEGGSGARGNLFYANMIEHNCNVPCLQVMVQKAPCAGGGKDKGGGKGHRLASSSFHV